MINATASFDFQGSNAAGFIGGLRGSGGSDGGFNTVDGAGLGGGLAGQTATCPTTNVSINDAGEGGGGGGGNLSTGATAGLGGVRKLDDGLPGVGGSAGPQVLFQDLNNFIFSGQGGAGGGDGCEADNTATELGGGGGGGGGGIQIVAGGDVTISGLINVNGGNGATGTDYGGGGGGGSGGIIILQTLGQLNIPGVIVANGGSGGPAVGPGNSAGGNGALGLIFLQDSDGIISCPGCSPLARTAATGVTSKLKSDISCGTVMPKNKNSAFQLYFGFMLAASMAALLKITRRLKFFS